VFFSRSALKFGVQSEFSLGGRLQLPRVEIVYSYANLGRDVIDYLVSAGVKGIVLAGCGEGNTTDEAIAGLQDAVKQGVAVVRSTRVGSGIVRRNIEVNDDRFGFIASGELNPQKARVLLMLALTKRAMFANYRVIFMNTDLNTHLVFPSGDSCCSPVFSIVGNAKP